MLLVQAVLFVLGISATSPMRIVEQRIAGVGSEQLPLLFTFCAVTSQYVLLFMSVDTSSIIVFLCGTTKMNGRTESNNLSTYAMYKCWFRSKTIRNYPTWKA